MDIVFIRDLHIDAIVGIYDWERKVRQPVLVNLEMAHDNVKPAKSKNIDDALNYKAVIDRVSAFVVEQKFELVETMAEDIASLLMTEFGVPWLRVSCAKPTVISNAKAVGVVIERGTRVEAVDRGSNNAPD